MNQTSHFRRLSRGFTLIELLAVVVIMAILVAFFIGTAGYIKRRAMDSMSRSQMQAIMTALENYKGDRGYYPVSPCDSPRMTYGGMSYPSPIGTRPYYYHSAGSNSLYLGHVTIPCVISNSAALYRALTPGYLKTKAGQETVILMMDYDTGFWSTNTVFVDPYTTPWGYFNTTDAGWKERQFNPVSFDLWSYGPYAFSYSFNCGPCGPTGSVAVSSSANPKNAMIANWLIQ